MWRAGRGSTAAVGAGACARVAGAVAVLALAGWYLRRRVRSAAVRVEPHVRRPARPRSAALIVNPSSGGGRADELDLVAAAEALGLQVLVVGEDDDLAAVARRAVAHGADAIGMAGGDGSLGPVAGVAAEAGVAFFCVPVGTRNHFALDLGLDRDDPLAALGALAGGEEVLVDCGVAGDRVFLNNVSFGVYGAAVHRDTYGSRSGQAVLDVIGEASGEDAVAPVRFAGPDGEAVASAAVTVVSNNPYVFAGPPDFGRRLRLDSGRLGVATVARPADGAAAAPVPKRWEVGRIRFRSDEPIRAGVDGEPVAFGTDVEVTVRRRALRVLVPAGTEPGYEPPAEALVGELADLLGLAGSAPPEGDGPAP